VVMDTQAGPRGCMPVLLLPTGWPGPSHGQLTEVLLSSLLSLSVRGHGRIAPVLCFQFGEFSPFPRGLTGPRLRLEENEVGQRHLPRLVLLVVEVALEVVDFLLREARRPVQGLLQLTPLPLTPRQA
jgi:hypothetical protein